MRKFLLATTMAAAVVVAAVAALLPPAPVHVPGPYPPVPRIWRGAFHVHSLRSDGAGTRQSIAAAAARAGLQFVVFTDHGDGTREPEPPAYLSGVLCIDGVEISTSRGHYVAVGLPAAPYPLGGDPAGVVEDVRRLGGFGVVAHPDSPKTELAWSDWDVPVDGVEWLNADSAWRDESGARLARTLLTYLVRPAATLGAILDRPPAALRQWDTMTATRPVVGLAGDDAHGGARGRVEEEGKRARVGGPSYEASFRAFSIGILAPEPSGDAARDAAVLIDALRHGRVYTAIDAYAVPAVLAFEARRGGARAVPGERLAGAGPASFEARAAVPPGGRLVLLRAGEQVAEARGTVLEAEANAPGAYRIEVRLDRRPDQAPWMVSNPIYVDLPPGAEPAAAPPRRVVAALEPAAWRVESDPASTGQVSADEGGLRFEWRLAAGERVSQFVALAGALPRPPVAFDAVRLSMRSSRPARVSIQVRAGEARWRKSVYVDGQARQVEIPFGELAAVLPSQPAVEDANLDSLLLVFDLVNTAPGTAGTLQVESAELLARIP
jgi:hypothetical protein